MSRRAPRDLLECGDRVVSLGEERALVRATGERFAVPFAHVIRVADGRIAELRGYVDSAAVAAAFAPAEGAREPRSSGNGRRRWVAARSTGTRRAGPVRSTTQETTAPGAE